jgi:hypothetical protein
MNERERRQRHNRRARRPRAGDDAMDGQSTMGQSRRRAQRRDAPGPEFYENVWAELEAWKLRQRSAQPGVGGAPVDDVRVDRE